MQEIAAKFPQVIERGVTYTILLLGTFNTWHLYYYTVLMKTVPREWIIVGPLDGCGIHFCLSEHLWCGFQTPNPLKTNEGDTPECISYCVLQDEVLLLQLFFQVSAN